MIPGKLQLRNFMCYRGSNNEIDFSSIHLACLAGDNGQGKSAILDAITWALWGKARARRDDDLITHGETEMEVQFEFELNGERYRVIRKRNASGRGSSVLELQGRTGDGFFAPLSEGTIRETQHRIKNLLRLDYDTFVNSAMLLQGRADEFTTKKPGERKQILVEILGLSRFDTYAARAKERSRAAEERRMQAEHDLNQIKEQVAQIPQIEEELVNAETAVKRLEQQVREATAVLEKLWEQRAEMDAKSDALTQAERQVKEARGEISKIEGRLTGHYDKLTRCDELLTRAEMIEQGFQRLEEARKDKERLDELLQKNSQLEREAGEHQRIVDQEKGRLESELRVAESEIRRCESVVERYQHRESELVEAQKQVEMLETRQDERQEDQRLLNQWKEASGQLKAENDQLKGAMHELKERMELLEKSGTAECPVCRRPLSEEARVEALQDAQQEGKRMGDRYRENEAERKRAGDEVARLEQKIARAEKELEELHKWQQTRIEATQAAEEIRRARQELETTERQALELRTRLESGDYAPEAQARLVELASASESLGYDGEAHEAAKQRIQELASYQQEFNELTSAREQRSTTEEIIQSLEENKRGWQQRIVAAEQEIETLSRELRQREEILRRAKEQQACVNGLQREASNAQRHLGGARQRLEYAEQHLARQPAVEAEHHAAVEERTLYDHLGQAFGRRGIQAMLVESALPELEAEANKLLGRMTDGRMSVSLHTQRESRSGDAIETLDIVIADENGERPYEMFSGGEAFRVNFALRIALSRLLAHRAGTSLRTLIIDEGFGSQDAQGRARLIEAITSVQDDFDRILVITHIDELKDAFPVRIDVVKGTSGSRITIN